MALVDDRGRVFGRFNPVDVFVFVLVVVMIPIAYGAYALFRTPQAKLTSVDPKQFPAGPSLRLRGNGTNLRPSMRVSVNTVQGRTFMIRTTETADVDLPDLEPSSYDVVLYDYAQEVDRLPKVLTIAACAANPDGVGAWRVRGWEQVQVDALRAGATLFRTITFRSWRPVRARLGCRWRGNRDCGQSPGPSDVPAVLAQCSSRRHRRLPRCIFHGPRRQPL
jgi:hypothetical protein